MEFDIKTTAGIGAVDDYVSVVKMGADEVFCGFVPLEWNKKFGNMQPLNRREVLFYHVQIGSYNEMNILKKMQEKYRVPVAITFNALYYTEQQIECILSIMKKLMEIGFKDFIVCDVALMLAMKKEHLACNLHISGEIGEWNRHTLKMFLEIMSEGQNHLLHENEKKEEFPQIKRIIFHRKNTLKDMESIIKYGKELCSDIEYEAFFMNEMCHFTGGFCNSLHCDEMVHICQMPYELAPLKREYGKEDVILKKWKRIQEAASGDEKEGMQEYVEVEKSTGGLYANTGDFEEKIPGESGCGFCALWKLAEIGVTHLKIVGRGKSISCMQKDVENVHKAIDILKDSSSEALYRKTMKQQLFKKNCSGNCYYREVLIPKINKGEETYEKEL